MSEAHALQKEMRRVAVAKACDIHVRVAKKLFRKANLFLERVHKISTRARSYMKKETNVGASGKPAKATKVLPKMGAGGKKTDGKVKNKAKAKAPGRCKQRWAKGRLPAPKEVRVKR